MTMESKSSLEFVAPTVPEALARGLARLGVREDQVDMTVLEEGRPPSAEDTGIPARVRLTVHAAGAEDSDLEAVRVVVQEVIDRMRIHARTTAQWMEPEDSRETRHVLVEIHGQDMGIMVSRRGEALMALQYVTRLIVARRLERPLPVIIDVEGFRQRREEQLRRMARRAAEQAVERGRTVMLEPMPANERRIIHIALRDVPDVKTESVGVGKQRKVTVVPNLPSESPEPKIG